MTDFQITQLAVAFGTLTTIIVGLYRESRARKWDLEDRNLRMQEAKAAIIEVKEATTQIKVEVAQAHEAIATNTQLTIDTKDAAHQAFDKANDTNEKIKTLHEDFVELKTTVIKNGNGDQK